MAEAPPSPTPTPAAENPLTQTRPAEVASAVAPSADGVSAEARAELDRQLAAMRARQAAEADHRRAGRRLWLAHHWPEHYEERCVRVAGRPVCRRCLSLYPLSLVVAIAAVAGYTPWPARFDPWPVWLLSIPPTVAYVGEAVGWFPYRARWQVAATLLAAVAFGRALGVELEHRWSPIFWGPIAVFGGIWFAATVVGQRRRSRQGRGHPDDGDDQISAATASSSSSSVL